MKTAYLRFLSLLGTLEQNSEFGKIDEESKRLLDVISLRHNTGSTLTVTDAMGLNAIASPATMHRKLDQLLLAGLISLEFREGNRRTKYLVPTQLSEAHYEKLGQALTTAIKNP